MNKINHICFIVPNYPTSNDPMYTFVKELICSIADHGMKCTVIAPQSVTNYFIKRKRKRPYHWQDHTEKGNIIDIFQPWHVPILNVKLNKKWNSIGGEITKRNIERTFKKLQIKPDILYAHFWHSAVIAGSIGEKHSIPVFVASGESKIWVDKLYNQKTIRHSIKNIKGAICVSTKNKEESIQLKLISENKTIVIPNAINNKRFFKKDKDSVREKLRFNKKDFIVSFLGSFNDRKGVLRVSKALESIPKARAIYIGKGSQIPNQDQALFIGKLPHNEIVDYLNASDVFVLPSLAEGCSNAIIEAMACGLPIISSDEPFNWDILDSSNAILINSKKIDEISKSLKRLYKNSKLQKKMGQNSLAKAEELVITNRAKNIVHFINKMV